LRRAANRFVRQQQRNEIMKHFSNHVKLCSQSFDAELLASHRRIVLSCRQQRGEIMTSPTQSVNATFLSYRRHTRPMATWGLPLLHAAIEQNTDEINCF
jgi:hypothetical protein